MRSTAPAVVLALAGCTGAPHVPMGGAAVLVAAPASLLLHDTFDASPTAPSGDFGLNVDLVHRQSGALVPATYSVLSGVWFDAPPAAPGTVRVGHLFEDGAAGRLSFHDFTAVRVNRPFAFDREGVLQVRARIDPVVGDVASMGWVSLVLTPVRDSSGWVLDPQNAMGFLLRSNGGVGLGSLGQDRPPRWEKGPPAPAPGYDVTLVLHAVSDGGARGVQVHGQVNEASFSATLAEGSDAPLQAGVYLELGAHFHGGDVKLSSVDDLFVFGAAAP